MEMVGGYSRTEDNSSMAVFGQKIKLAEWGKNPGISVSEKNTAA